MHVGAHGREHPLHSTATSPILGFPHLRLERCSRETAWRCSTDHSGLCVKGKFTALSWLRQAAFRGKQAEREGGVDGCRRGDVEGVSVVDRVLQ